jgi:hypothetical protein
MWQTQRSLSQDKRSKKTIHCFISPLSSKLRILPTITSLALLWQLKKIVGRVFGLKRDNARGLSVGCLKKKRRIARRALY